MSFDVGLGGSSHTSSRGFGVWNRIAIRRLHTVQPLCTAIPQCQGYKQTTTEQLDQTWIFGCNIQGCPWKLVNSWSFLTLVLYFFSFIGTVLNNLDYRGEIVYWSWGFELGHPRDLKGQGSTVWQWIDRIPLGSMVGSFVSLKLVGFKQKWLYIEVSPCKLVKIGFGWFSLLNEGQYDI